MKHLYVVWLFATILIVSCEKSEMANSSAGGQDSKTQGGGWHSYSLTITPLDGTNTMCKDLMLNVATDKNSRGKIVLNEFDGPNGDVLLHKWEADNTNNVIMNTGKSNSSQRYFGATFVWGSTIIVSGNKPIGISSCK
jgi:hypothetical protein